LISHIRPGSHFSGALRVAYLLSLREEIVEGLRARTRSVGTCKQAFEIPAIWPVLTARCAKPSIEHGTAAVRLKAVRDISP
jgi:hypothetical protein